MHKSPDLQHLLTPVERLLLVDVIDALESVNDTEGLVACTDSIVQKLLPHGRFAAALTYLSENTVNPYRILLNRFPRGYIDEILNPRGFRSPMVVKWRQTLQPVLMDPRRNDRQWQKAWVDNLAGWGISNCASHGLIDVQGVTASYFSFVDCDEMLSEKHAYLLSRLVPFFHNALVRAIETLEPLHHAEAMSGSAVQFTQRQKDVLLWLREGKTNWEIAKILDTTEHNVKYHMKQIFSRLNASNRSQAVAKAITLNIIDT